ncbi:MAG: caspase family protein [Pseudomonadota bacterium]
MTAFFSQASAETRHAVLIGVSDYGASVAQLAPRLNGPGNDVALMYDLIAEARFDAANVAVLTSRAHLLSQTVGTSVTKPTRRAIMDALENLVERVSTGDQVLLYFAGHGAQLPNQNTDWLDDEPDGLDEVFLPSDFEIIEENGNRYANNEIRDDEIGNIIDRLLARGAHVWLIADTCHAGTLRRGEGRWLVPRQLSLVDKTMSKPERQTDSSARLAEPRDTVGRFVAFYGADAGALAYETQVQDYHQSEGMIVHGVMTWALGKAIRAGARDYRDLARLTREAVWTATAGRANPAFSGVLGGTPLLGDAGAQDLIAPVQFLDGEFVLGAGLLDGLVDGLTVKLSFRGPGGHIVPLAKGQIEQTDLSASILELPDVGSADTVELDRQIAAEGLDPQVYRERWLEARAPSLFVSPSEPRLLRSHPFVIFENKESFGELAARISTTLLDMPRAETAIRQQDTFAITLHEDNTVLRLSYEEADRDILVPATPQGIEDMQILIQRVHRAREIAQVGAVLSRRNLSKRLVTKATIAPSVGEGCSNNQNRLVEASRLIVYHCDKVKIELTNEGPETLDITPLYLAPDGQIFFLTGYTGSERGGLRLQPDETRQVVYREEISSNEDEMATTGSVKLLFLAVTAEQDGSPPVDFRFLQTAASRDVLRAAPRQSTLRSLNSLASFIQLTNLPRESGFSLEE